MLTLEPKIQSKPATSLETDVEKLSFVELFIMYWLGWIDWGNYAVVPDVHYLRGLGDRHLTLLELRVHEKWPVGPAHTPRRVKLTRFRFKLINLSSFSSLRLARFSPYDIGLFGIEIG